jgi:hypothetical protein
MPTSKQLRENLAFGEQDITKKGFVIETIDGEVLIDEDEVLHLAKLYCTNKEISEWFGVTVDDIKKYFADVLRRGRVEVKYHIRQAQYKLAIEDRNTTMLVWLGKNLLKQSESGQLDSDDVTPLPWTDDFRTIQDIGVIHDASCTSELSFKNTSKCSNYIKGVLSVQD